MDHQRAWAHFEIDRPSEGWNQLGIHALQVRLSGASIYSSKDSNYGYIGTIPFDYVQVTAPHKKAYEDWVRELEASLGLKQNAASLSKSDSDGDGLKDLSEFALGSDPLSGEEPFPLETAVDEVEGKKYMTLTFTRRSNATGLVWAIQSSIDGKTWKTVDSQFEVVASELLNFETEQLTLRSQATLKELDSKLFRITTQV